MRVNHPDIELDHLKEIPKLKIEHVDLWRFETINTVDGRNLAPVDMVKISHYVQGFKDVRWFAGFQPSTGTKVSVKYMSLQRIEVSKSRN